MPFFWKDDHGRRNFGVAFAVRHEQTFAEQTAKVVFLAAGIRLRGLGGLLSDDGNSVLNSNSRANVAR